MRMDTAFSNALVAENRLIAEVKMVLARTERIFCFGLGMEELMSPEGLLFCEKCIEVLDKFVLKQDESALKLARVTLL